MDRTGKLIVLTGPSCVGKSPLATALKRFRPDLADPLQPLVLHNSRPPRPGEIDNIDYHFRDRSVIESLRDSQNHAVLEVRGDLQALDFNELDDQLARGDVLFEGNPFVAKIFLEHPRICEVRKSSLFMSPLSRAEFECIHAADISMPPDELVAELMRRKLFRRFQRQKGTLTKADRAEVERRCRSAYRELTFAPLFDSVIANHDGEDSENWSDFGMPLGDARRALQAFVTFLLGEKCDALESWKNPG